MEKRIGFIGCGNMGKAMLSSMLSSGFVAASQVMVSCKSNSSKEAIEQQWKVATTCDNTQVIQWADILILAVKPNLLETVLPQVAKEQKKEQLIVSVAAGKKIAFYESFLSKEYSIVRLMPNTPAFVGKGMTGMSCNEKVSLEQQKEVLGICESFGKVLIVPESLMDTVVGVSGSSPAYGYVMIEAMADAAVADGMPRDQAYEFAAQSLLGAAAMVLETKQHPGVLKDAVCSPGGTTIAAVAKLEETGFRNSVIAAQRACVAKSKELGK